MNKFLVLIVLFISQSFIGQSIVNTEKLFTSNDDGLGVSSELAGSSISGNASVLLLGYSLNFSYKKTKIILDYFLEVNILIKTGRMFQTVFLLNLGTIIL